MDNEELKAENARLKAKIKELENDAELYYRESMSDEYDLNSQNEIINGLMKDKEKLKQEVQRLTNQKAVYIDNEKILKEMQRLQTEVDELRLENQAYRRTVNEASCYYDNLLSDNARLKSSIDRLTEAGNYLYTEVGIHSRHHNCSVRDDWLRAKMGLPSLSKQWERQKAQGFNFVRPPMPNVSKEEGQSNG